MVEVVAPVKSGERYSLTVAVTDGGGKSSQAIMEVKQNFLKLKYFTRYL